MGYAPPRPWAMPKPPSRYMLDSVITPLASVWDVNPPPTVARPDVAARCDYCKSPKASRVIQCRNCGAP